MQHGVRVDCRPSSCVYSNTCIDIFTVHDPLMVPNSTCSYATPVMVLRRTGFACVRPATVNRGQATLVCSVSVEIICCNSVWYCLLETRKTCSTRARNPSAISIEGLLSAHLEVKGFVPVFLVASRRARGRRGRGAGQSSLFYIVSLRV